MLMLRSGKGFTSKAICAAWADLFPKEAPLTVSDTDKTAKNSVATFESGGRTLMLTAMPVPIPQPEVDEAAEVSWMWTDAAAEVKTQKAHAIAVAVPGQNAIAEALGVSRLLAAAALSSDSVGVYWGGGGQVHKPAFFIDAVKDFDGAESLPAMVWVGLRISGRSAKGPFTLTTQGMTPFGHKELEIIDTKMPVGDLRMMTYGIIDYLLKSGPVLKDGNTFGASATEKFKVEHTTSKFRDGEPVVRLHVP